jgi:membrane-associated phospholipid phosphatase
MLKILTNHRTFFIIFLLWVIIGALLQFFFTQTDIMFWLNQQHNSFFDEFFENITYLGEDFIWLALLGYFVFVSYFQKITKLKEIKLLIITWLAKVFVSVSLKNIFNLPRPMEVYQNFGREIHLVNGVEIYHWQSFPSGHTMTAFAFVCFVAIVLNKPKWSVVCLLIAMLVGISRIYLFQHFPRDVFAGSVLGMGVVMLTAFFMNRN